MTENRYLIWSNEHGAWWRAGGYGYTSRVESAGRVSQEDALHICMKAMLGRRGNAPFPEIPVRVEDVELMLKLFAAICPDVDAQPPAGDRIDEIRAWID